MTIKTEEFLYGLKACLCAGLFIALCIFFPGYENFFAWSSISAFFTIQVKITRTINLNQIKANLIGSLAGFLVWLLIYQFNQEIRASSAIYAFIMMGAILVVILCFVFAVIDVIGAALTGYIIVALYDISHETFNGGALRLAFSTGGCLSAILMDRVFYIATRLLKDGDGG